MNRAQRHVAARLQNYGLMAGAARTTEVLLGGAAAKSASCLIIIDDYDARSRLSGRHGPLRNRPLPVQLAGELRRAGGKR